MTRKVGIYARVSTEDQDAKAQINRCKQWAQAQGYTIAGVWAETASGRKEYRPEQADLMGEAMGRRVEVIACAKIDRWARSLSHLRKSIDKLHGRGIEFCAVDQGLRVVPGDPTSDLILNVLGSVAQWEAAIISERTKEALAERKAEGIKLGRPRAKCYVCGDPRPPELRAKVDGQSQPVCQACKQMDPAKRRAQANARHGGEGKGDGG